MTEKLEAMLKDVRTLAVICNQWGDTGKGKFVDYFADVWADLIIRGTGANNAGHTIVIGDKEYIVHLIPSGIVNEDKTNVIGNGVLVNLAVLQHEMDMIAQDGISLNNLRISNHAHLATPDDMILEYFREKARGKGAIGTTMRGVGPGFSGKIARTGVRIGHLFNKDEFVKRYGAKLAANLAIIKEIYGASDEEIIEVMNSDKFKINSRFKVDRPDLDDITSELMGFGEKIREMVVNTQLLVAEYRKQGKNVLLEGAQGLLLSIDHGTYPFVTSSDCSAAGLASGCGIPPQSIDLVLGIVKMFYMTRVGAGPFPTEFVPEDIVKNGLPDEKVLKDLGLTPKAWEREKYDREKTLTEIAKNDPKALSRYCRVEGAEYGATTGRPRRTGWLDLVALRYAVAINGPDIISTKSDVLDHLETIKLCVAYKYEGPAVYCPEQGKFIQAGDEIQNFVADPFILEHIKPVYIEMDGWKSDTSGIRDYKDLPKQKQKLYEEVEKRTGAKVRIVSVGADRKETIIRAA